AVTERVGALLAERLTDRAVDVVLSWDESEDTVLAHIVARELGVHTVQVFNQGGILFLTSDISSGEKVLLVSDAFRSSHALLGPIGLVHSVGAEVVGIAATESSIEVSEVMSDDI